MDKRYHISPHTGAPGICRAKEGKCPYGDVEHHYATAVEARAAYEAEADAKVAPTYRSRKEERLDQELLEDFKYGQLGFKQRKDLTRRERDIATHEYQENDQRFTELYGYYPTDLKMIRIGFKRGNNFRISLVLDKQNGHLYGVAVVSKYAMGMSSKHGSLYNVLDYGKDLSQAVAGTQDLTDRTQSNFINLQDPANKPLYTEIMDDEERNKRQTSTKYNLSRTMYPAPEVFTRARNEIVGRLANQVPAKKIQAEKLAQNLEALEETGYQVDEA